MHWLEHRIPPPFVALFVGAAMWGCAQISPQFQVGEDIRVVAAIIFVVFGLAVTLLGAAAFRRAQTTLNPLKPETASALVVNGVYRYTRNPMYVGFALALAGWAIYLSALLAFFGPVLFVLFITHFQIIPEERVLRVKFGQQFDVYQQRVRRWL